MSAATSTYLLRDVPAELWERVKQRAALDRLPLRSVLLLLADSYATGQISMGGVQLREPNPRSRRLMALGRAPKRTKGGAR